MEVKLQRNIELEIFSYIEKGSWITQVILNIGSSVADTNITKN